MFKSLLSKVRVLCLLTACVVSSLAVTAQTKVTGHVIGTDDKQGVVGAAVRVKGTTIGTVTDVNGNFTLNVTPGQTLVISYVGYVTREVVATSAPMSISLAVGNNALNEVVVTGYTSQRKKDISGAVATVDVTAAKQLPTASSDQLLQGQAAGVTVVAPGNPGSAAQVFVRGISNFANSQPLYVIDGVQTNSMNDVNPNDIESISVLKDAGAAAIYGVAGGNGVILITTKKGKGKSTISYDGYVGTQRPLSGNVFNLMSGAEYETLLKQVDPTNAVLLGGRIADYGYGQGSNAGSARGVANAGDPLVAASRYKYDPTDATNNYIIQAFDRGAGTDWYHTLFKPAMTQSHTLSASGANEKNSYYFSAGYLNQKGTLDRSYYKRYQTRINTTFNVKEHIRFGENANIYYTEQPGGFTNNDEGNALAYSYRTLSIIPVYDISGKQYGGTFAGPAALGNATNELGVRENMQYNRNRSWNVSGLMFLEADILKHFTARTAFGGEFNNIYNRSIGFPQYFYGEGYSGANNTTENAQYYTKYNFTNTLRYAQIFGKHNISAIAGYEIKDNSTRYINGTGNALFSLDPNYVTLSGTTQGQVITSGVYYQPASTQSYFAKLDYIYNDRYILSGTVRRDGSSAFSANQRYGTFPSVTAAWRISQEDFMKGIEWINDLKLRGSYGVAGFNGNVPGANAYSTFGSGPTNSYYPISGTINSAAQGFYNTSLGNANTSWERDKISNVGIDATLFRNLELSAEYFVKNSSNLLFSVTLPATVGGSAVAGSGAPTINIGSVRNAGFEFAATYHGRSGPDFTWNVGGNINFYRNKITSLFTNYIDVSGSRITTIVRQQVGMPIGSFFGYKQIGYFSSAADVAASPTQTDAAPGRFKYADVDGDGKITDADRTFIGNPNPDFTYGINLSATYKGFDFAANFYGSYGNKVFNTNKYWTNFYGSFVGNKSRDLLYNAWSPSNLNPKVPLPESGGGFSTYGTISSYYVEPGSFLKAKVVQIGYTFKPSMLKYIGVDKLNIYVQATNLFTITKYSGLDPEILAVGAYDGGNQTSRNNLGIDYGNYPNNEKKFLVGARFTF